MIELLVALNFYGLFNEGIIRCKGKLCRFLIWMGYYMKAMRHQSQYCLCTIILLPNFTGVWYLDWHYSTQGRFPNRLSAVSVHVFSYSNGYSMGLDGQSPPGWQLGAFLIIALCSHAVGVMFHKKWLASYCSSSNRHGAF